MKKTLITGSQFYKRENLRFEEWGHLETEYPELAKLEYALVMLSQEIPFQNLSLPEHWKNPQKLLRFLEPKIGPSRLEIKNLGSLKKLENIEIKDSHFERIFHSIGRSYRDLISMYSAEELEFFDAILYPKNKDAVLACLNWAAENQVAVVPFGGGSSVVGGVLPRKTSTQKAVVALDLFYLNKIVSINPENLEAKIEAGIYGPVLEAGLNQAGFTLGHFPQSFEYSTLGGWVATRSAGQFSNYYGKIEDLVLGLSLSHPELGLQTFDKMRTSFCGPDFLQFCVGSEGKLGVITEVSVKIKKQERAFFEAVLFPNFESGLAFVKQAAQEEWPLLMTRLSDATETRLSSLLKGKPIAWKKKLQHFYLTWKGYDQKACILIWGKLESAKNYQSKVDSCIAEKGGLNLGTNLGQRWFAHRFALPFVRRHFLQRGLGVETFETLQNYEQLENTVVALKQKYAQIEPQGQILMHISHAYTFGACLYFTLLFPIDIQNPLAQWKKIKSAMSEILLKQNASISHHHGIGQDHQSFYFSQINSFSKRLWDETSASFNKNELINPHKI